MKKPNPPSLLQINSLHPEELRGASPHITEGKLKPQQLGQGSACHIGVLRAHVVVAVLFLLVLQYTDPQQPVSFPSECFCVEEMSRCVMSMQLSNPASCANIWKQQRHSPKAKADISTSKCRGEVLNRNLQGVSQEKQCSEQKLEPAFFPLQTEFWKAGEGDEKATVSSLGDFGKQM